MVMPDVHGVIVFVMAMPEGGVGRHARGCGMEPLRRERKRG